MVDWSQVETAEQRADREAQARRSAERAARQERIDQLTVEVDDLVFQGDEVSQGRMLRRADTMSDGETVDWVLADNTIAQVTAAQLRAAARAAVDEMGRIWIGAL